MSLTIKVLHASVDLALASAFLAGVKRSTGLAPDFDRLDEGLVKTYGQKYMNFGDYVFDQSVGYIGASSYFKKEK